MRCIAKAFVPSLKTHPSQLAPVSEEEARPFGCRKASRRKLARPHSLLFFGEVNLDPAAHGPRVIRCDHFGLIGQLILPLNLRPLNESTP